MKRADLLDRLAVLKGKPVVLTRWEWEEWPGESVTALQAARLLVGTRPVARIVCPGCEYQCYQPIEFFPEQADGRPARAYGAGCWVENALHRSTCKPNEAGSGSRRAFVVLLENSKSASMPCR